MKWNDGLLWLIGAVIWLHAASRFDCSIGAFRWYADIPN